MKPIYRVRLQYFPSPHLSQLYDGFQKLHNAGIIELTRVQVAGDNTKPLLTATINGRKVIYDTLDGLNWVEGSTEDNLKYFKDHINADFYFKRSFKREMVASAPLHCRVYPLGLNLSFHPEGSYPMKFTGLIRHTLRDNPLVRMYFGKSAFKSSDFEYYPVSSGEGRVLFLARLWNPDDVSSESLKRERERINQGRIACIKACRDAFGEQFVGGLQDDEFSRRSAKEFIVPNILTRRANFLSAIKQSDICVATTGLHDSIGWKFGEYIAASRAIVTEPLNYQLPGNFSEGQNYLVHHNEQELVKNINQLRSGTEMLMRMMNNNFSYYHSHVRPDMLVLNTLMQIDDGITPTGK